MLIYEFRVILPMTVAEYQVAQLWSVAEASKNETGGGEGIEVQKNEPYKDHPLLTGQPEHGQYTYKIYHLKSKVGPVIGKIAPQGALKIEEEAWNAYPYCRTIVTNKEYMKESFQISIETLHEMGDGSNKNAHALSPEKLAKRKVVVIDIAADPVKRSDYKAEWDPTKVRCERADRGPLDKLTWKENTLKENKPLMCAYKLVTCEFIWFGFQGLIEKFIIGAERRIFTNFHRQMFCWMDKWYGLTMEDIRAIEDETKHKLDQQRATGTQRGTIG